MEIESLVDEYNKKINFNYENIIKKYEEYKNLNYECKQLNDKNKVDNKNNDDEEQSFDDIISNINQINKKYLQEFELYTQTINKHIEAAKNYQHTIQNLEDLLTSNIQSKNEYISKNGKIN